MPSVGKPGTALKDKQLTVVQHVRITAKTCLYGYWRVQQVQCYEFLPFVFVTHIHFGRQKHILPSQTWRTHSSAWCSRTLQLYLYSGYLASLSDFFPRLQVAMTLLVEHLQSHSQVLKKKVVTSSQGLVTPISTTFRAVTRVPL